MSDFVIENGVLIKYVGTDENVIIPEGVFSIGKKAFYCCEKIRSVTIPQGITSIGEWAFYCCKKIRSVTIPQGITSIGEWAFASCSNLMSVLLSECTTSIGKYAFLDNKNLKLIASVESGKSIDDSTLAENTEVHLSSLEYYMKWDIGISHDLYIQGELIKDLVISEDTSGLENGAFSGCKSLQSIVIPDSVTRIGAEAFEQCTNLVSVTLPEGITCIEREAFQDCRSLKNVVLPQRVNRIGDSAFSSCESITEIILPEGVTDIETHAFSMCSSLERIVFPKSLVHIGDNAFIDSGLKEIVLPEGLQTIEGFAFSYCHELKSVIMPGSMVSVGDFAFAFSENLTRIVTGTKLTAKVFGKTKLTQPIVTEDIGMLPNTLKPYAAIGFAENPDDLKSVRGKSHIKYIKASAATLLDTALEHTGLLRLMLENKLLTTEVAEAYMTKAQAGRRVEAIAMLLDYQQNKLTSTEKKKAAEKAEAREEKITEFVFGSENMEQMQGRVFVVTGKLKTFSSRDEFKACLDACGAVLSETLNEQTDYLITNTPDSGSAKNKKAEQLGVKKITEDEFNQLIGRAQL